MKRERFCPSCGNLITEKQEFCKACRPSIEFECKSLDFKICEKCQRYLSKNKWHDCDCAENAIIHLIKDSTKNRFSKITPKIPDVTMAAGVNVDFKAIAVCDFDEFELKGRFLVTICPHCSKENTTYFEGILQLRNPKSEVQDFIDKMLSDVKVRGIHASSIREVKNGLDYYITSKSFLRKIGKELKKRFSGDFNESAQLFTRNHQTSRDVYRLNVLFRCK